MITAPRDNRPETPRDPERKGLVRQTDISDPKRVPFFPLDVRNPKYIHYSVKQ